jgi:hypothetical protein
MSVLVTTKRQLRTLLELLRLILITLTLTSTEVAAMIVWEN